MAKPTTPPVQQVSSITGTDLLNGKMKFSDSLHISSVLRCILSWHKNVWLEVMVSLINFKIYRRFFTDCFRRMNCSLLVFPWATFIRILITDLRKPYNEFDAVVLVSDSARTWLWQLFRFCLWYLFYCECKHIFVIFFAVYLFVCVGRTSLTHSASNSLYFL